MTLNGVSRALRLPAGCVTGRGGLTPFGHGRRGHKHARDLRRAGVEQHARSHEPAVHGEDVTRDLGGFV
jgi:hypothetical protein